jgi:hypothetical protein
MRLFGRREQFQGRENINTAYFPCNIDLRELKIDMHDTAFVVISGQF